MTGPIGGARPEVAVIGAGVIGLTLAVCLAERGREVVVLSRDQPLATTSAVASAMIGPALGPDGDPLVARVRAGVEAFTALAGVTGTGVYLRRGRLVSWTEEPPPPGGEPCAPGELPDGFGSGFWTRLPLADMRIYLDYLTRRLAAAGGRIEEAELGTLAQAAALAPLVANCSGLGARELVPDATVTAVRGQHVIVDNPGLEEFFVEDPVGPAWTAYWPYPDHVVLGGIKVPGDENTEPDPAVAAEILDRCGQVEPRLRGARVRGHQVGLRPTRPTVRLEAENLGGTRLVHNYGHGSAGVMLSWGCAREAADLLLGPTARDED
jgi:D-amino-acid oxidase